MRTIHLIVVHCSATRCDHPFPVTALIRCHQDRFGFEPEITSRVARAGLRVYEVGISYNGRTYKEGKHIGWKDGFRVIWCIFKYR